jgi:hypothetical protein
MTAVWRRSHLKPFVPRAARTVTKPVSNHALRPAPQPVIRQTLQPASKPTPQPAPRTSLTPSSNSPRAPSEASSDQQAHDAPIQQRSIYELNPDELRAGISAVEVRENRIRISIAHQQAMLRAEDPESQESKEIRYKESQLLNALGLQGTRKLDLRKLLRKAGG